MYYGIEIIKEIQEDFVMIHFDERDGIFTDMVCMNYFKLLLCSYIYIYT